MKLTSSNLSLALLIRQVLLSLPRNCSTISVIQIITFVDTVWNRVDKNNINLLKTHNHVWHRATPRIYDTCVQIIKSQTSVLLNLADSDPGMADFGKPSVGWISAPTFTTGWVPFCSMQPAHTTLSPTLVRAMVISKPMLEM